MTFLKILAFSILGYYLLKFVFRLLAPWLVRYAARKTQAHFEERFRGARQDTTPEGEVHIEKAPGNRNKPTGDQVGEYIEFEEID